MIFYHFRNLSNQLDRHVMGPHLDTVNDLDSSNSIDLGNIAGVKPAFIIDGLLGVLLI